MFKPFQTLLTYCENTQLCEATVAEVVFVTEEERSENKFR